MECDYKKHQHIILPIIFLIICISYTLIKFDLNKVDPSNIIASVVAFTALLYSILYSIKSDKEKNSEKKFEILDIEIQNTLKIIRTLDINRLSYRNGLAEDTLYELYLFSQKKLKEQIYLISINDDNDNKIVEKMMDVIIAFERITSAYERASESSNTENQIVEDIRLFFSLDSGVSQEVGDLKELLAKKINNLKDIKTKLLTNND